MNILIRGVESYLGYQTKILNKIWDKVPCEKCVIISRCHDGKDTYAKSKYVNISHWDAVRGIEYNIEDVEAIPEWVLYGMKEYETRIYETMIRHYSLPIYTFEECKDRYFHEVLYWYHVLKKYDIKYIIFHVAPHFMHDYIIYCLGQVLKIPTLLFMPTFFPGRMEWGTSYDNLGLTVENAYKQRLAEHKDICLPDDLVNIYNKYRNGFSKNKFVETNKNFRSMYEKYTFDRFWVKRENIKARRNCILNNIISSKLNSSEQKEAIHEYCNDVDLTIRGKLYLKNNIDVSQFKNFEHISKRTLNCKYIYLGLQTNPEASLMPKLSVFYEQRHMINILAKAAEKCGVMVYIKEHWAQNVREKNLYDFIGQFKNVHLFGPNESNIELIQNSIAVSSGTGSCIMEGMFNSIPAIVFGDGYMIGAPGVYRIHDEEECIMAINQILNKQYDISDEKIRYYLQAISDETIPMNPYQIDKLGSTFTDDESVNNISEFIIRWIEDQEKVKADE